MSPETPDRPADVEIAPESESAEGKRSALEFPVVGIGASAGGIEALKQLLESLDGPLPMAFVIVLHLDPSHESHISDVLGRSTPMKVQEATSGVVLEPGQVYVIPPHSDVALKDGHLELTPRTDTKTLHLPVDHLFRSMAAEQGARSIAVILSGSGADGTLGATDIKAAGGITFAQDEMSARHAGMPRSAAARGAVDFVATPADIATRLASIAKHPYLAQPRRPRAPSEEVSQTAYPRILGLVRNASRVDFTHYRDTTIRRRITRRMAIHGIEDMARYVEMLERDRAEIQALFADLLINVTSFFRDPGMFDALKSDVLPRIVERKGRNAPLRFWVAGCSNGQEAYSLAMVLCEFFDDKPQRPPISIFATDLVDAEALEKARSGLYPESIEAELGSTRLRRFFRREGDWYRIDKSIRDLCVFARQNIAADPPFSHIDLVTCRNVLIYMAPALQKRVLPTFHYALNVNGFLVLGSAETIGEFTDLFEPVDRVHKIYAKKPTAVRPLAPFAVDEYRLPRGAPRRADYTGSVPADFHREADRLLLARFAPPSVLVNENFDIVQFRGSTSEYLEPPAGEPTTSVLKMAREGLFNDLRSALTEAKRTDAAVVREGVPLRREGRTRRITLRVIPVRPVAAERACWMVLFDEDAARDGGQQDGAAQRRRSRSWLERFVGSETRRSEAAGTEAELALVRQELVSTREYLQSLVEQQDAANEELRSANEEILSSNEELQSTNEELETAKEELQSANEELTTVNEQLQHRNLELNETTNDLSNLISSISIPVVMIGSDLRIRRVTGSARKVLNLLPSDVGRPIAHIKTDLQLEDLEDKIADVIERVQPFEQEVRDGSGRWNMLRIHPYRTSDNRTDGAVLVVIDIDQLSRARQSLEEQASQLRRQAALIDLSEEAIVVCDQARVVRFWSRGAELMYRWSAADALGRTIGELFGEDSGAFVKDIGQGDSWEGELSQLRRDGTPITVLSKQVSVNQEAGVASGVLLVNRDITGWRTADESLKEADRRKNEFLAVLGHELRNPLSSMLNAVNVMKRAKGDGPQATQARDILERQCNQLVRLVDELLDISRVVQGRLDLRRGSVLVSRMIAASIETSRPFLDGAGNEFAADIAPQPMYVQGDAARLSQAVTNLLINASKFTPAGGKVRLIVERAGERLAPGPGSVSIKVQDTGVGIAPELLPRVFNLFTQGPKEREPRFAGLGIGLTVTRNVVEGHGGTIEASSPGRGGGAVFEIRLPLVAPPTEPKQERRRSDAPRGSRRVLLVDDNKDVADSLEALISMLGHEVKVAHDGATALRIAQESRPEIALIDLEMPEMSGYELAPKLLAVLPDVTLVAQTGYGVEEYRERARSAGFHHFIMKPVDVEALSELLES